MGLQLVGLRKYERALAKDWSKLGSFCMLLVSEGFSVMFSRGRRRRPKAITSLEVKPEVVARAVQRLGALRSKQVQDKAGLSTSASWRSNC